jgi:Uma2 family endonuclease
MASTTLVSVEEYLNTSFPDADYEYLDGQLVETTVGEKDHGRAQHRTGVYLENHYGTLWIASTVRMRVTPTRYRVPDLIVFKACEPEGRVITQVPYIVIEFISRSDRAEDLEDKLHEYLDLGIPNIWLLTPRTRRAVVHTSDAAREVKDSILRTQDGEIEIPLAEIFA